MGGGVAALLAAAAGRGFEGFGAKVPIVKSPRRQMLVGLVGIGLIVAGLTVKEGGSAPPPPLPMPQLEVGPLRVINFRSSAPGDALNPDSSQGYMLVTTVISVRNTSEPARTATWKSSGATLRVNGAAIPYQDYFFTNLTDSGEPWLGENATPAAPVTIRAGEAAQREVMFMPANTGTGRYRWADFLRQVTRPNADLNPVFEVTIVPAVGTEDSKHLTARCVAQIDELLGDISQRRGRWITAQCR